MEDRENFWGEEWVALELEELGDNERFEISNYGRVKLYDQEKGGWKIIKTYNGRKDGSDYDFFCRTRYVDGKKKRLSKPMHRLVANYFCKKPSETHKFVIHLNYRKTDNYFKNLQWVTQKELTDHNMKNPNVLAYKKRRNGTSPNAKLTETEVIRIKKRLKRGKRKLYKIAEEFGITHTQLNRIRSGENWNHVKVD